VNSEPFFIIIGGAVLICSVWHIFNLFRKLTGDLVVARLDAKRWKKAAIDAEVQRIRELHGDVQADSMRERFRYMPPELVCEICGVQERKRREDKE